MLMKMRISVNHIRSLQGYYYGPRKLPNDEVGVEKPLIAGKPAVELMDIITEKLCVFAQGFMVLSIDLAVPKAFYLEKADPVRMKKEFGKFGKYVKFCYGFTDPNMDFVVKID